MILMMIIIMIMIIIIIIVIIMPCTDGILITFMRDLQFKGGHRGDPKGNLVKGGLLR